MSSGIQGMTGSIGGMLSGAMSSSLGGIVSVVAQIPRLVLGISDAVKDVAAGILDSVAGIISLDWIGDLVTSVLDSVGDLVDAILDLPENLADVVGSVLEGAGKLAGGVVGRVGNILSFGALSSNPLDWFGFGSNVEEMEAEIERLSRANEALADSIDGLSERIKDGDATTAQSVSAYRQALDAEREREKNQREAMHDKAGEHPRGDHSWGYYVDSMGKDWHVWQAFNRTLAENGYSRRIASGGDFLDLSPEEMKLLKDYNPSEWQDLIGVKGIDPRDLMDEYVEMAGKAEELTDALDEAILGVSWDGFRDGYAGLLADLDSDNKDFADKFEDYMRDAFLSNLVSDKYADRLKKLYDDWAAAVGNGTAEEEWVLDNLRREEQRITEDMLADRERYKEAFGWDAGGGEDLEATSKGFRSMGQDTAEELAGRFTALQIAGEAAASYAGSVSAAADKSCALLSSGAAILSDLRSLSSAGNGYLEDIARYSRLMYSDFGRKLDALVANTKNL